MGRILAAADIGSNTAHLLIAEILSDGKLKRIENESEWLSLGESVARFGAIPDEKADRLVVLLRNYELICRQRQAERLFVFATEAMRAATNRKQVLERLRVETGVEVRIISPLVEAELSLVGAKTDAPSSLALLIEVGGGSAQVAFCGPGERVAQEFSLPIGTGRLIADAELGQPATHAGLERVRAVIEEAVRVLPAGLEVHGSAVASGGVGRGLMRALHPDGDQLLTRKEIEFLAWSAARLSINQIVERFGVKPKRAAALLPGALAYLAILDRYGIEQIFVSEFGVREGAILSLADGRLDAWLG